MELAPQTPQSDSDQWHYIIQGRQGGPVALEELRAMIARGQADSASLVWRAGMEQWAYAGTVSELYPQGAPPPLPVVAGYQGGIWRHGKTLIVHRAAQLPPRCLKSNSEDVRMVKKKFVWNPPWVYLLLLAGLLPLLIAALLTQKRAELTLYLAPKYISRRRWATFLGLIGILVLVVTISVAVVEETPFPFLFGIVVLVACAIAAAALTPRIKTAKIDDTYIHLRGCGAEYLASFPEAPAR